MHLKTFTEQTNGKFNVMILFSGKSENCAGHKRPEFALKAPRSIHRGSFFRSWFLVKLLQRFTRWECKCEARSVAKCWQFRKSLHRFVKSSFVSVIYRFNTTRIATSNHFLWTAKQKSFKLEFKQTNIINIPNWYGRVL